MIWILNGVWRLSYLGSPSMDAGVTVDQRHGVDDLGVIDRDHGQHDHGHLQRQEVSCPWRASWCSPLHSWAPPPRSSSTTLLRRLPTDHLGSVQREEPKNVCEKLNTIDVSPGWREGRFWSEVLDSISLWGCLGRFFPTCRCSGDRSEWWTVPLAFLWQSSNPLNPVLNIDVMLCGTLTLGAVIG